MSNRTKNIETLNLVFPIMLDGQNIPPTSLWKKIWIRFRMIFLSHSTKPLEIKKKTVGVVFRSQLRDLMNVISETNPYFIRCIKPNDQNVKNVFNDIRVNQQLKYSGVLEAVRVARNGYPVRPRS